MPAVAENDLTVEVAKLPCTVVRELSSLGKLALSPIVTLAPLAMVVMLLPVGKFSVPPSAFQVPAVRVEPEYCVTVPVRLRVPAVTDTVPVLLKVTPTVLVLVAALKVPWLVNVPPPVPLDIGAPSDWFQAAPTSLMMRAPPGKTTGPAEVLNVAVPTFSRIRPPLRMI